MPVKNRENSAIARGTKAFFVQKVADAMKKNRLHPRVKQDDLKRAFGRRIIFAVSLNQLPHGFTLFVDSGNRRFRAVRCAHETLSFA